MFTMAAHTGARRSELLRSQRSDFDFNAGVVTIRESRSARRGGGEETELSDLSDLDYDHDDSESSSECVRDTDSSGCLNDSHSSHNSTSTGNYSPTDNNSSSSSSSMTSSSCSKSSFYIHDSPKPISQELKAADKQDRKQKKVQNVKI